MTFIETAPSAQAKLLAIKTVLGATANFREAMARKYSHDGRNALAAQLLQSLASENPQLPEHMLAEISACNGLAIVARDVAQKVGFGIFPESLAEFIHTVLLRAAEQRKEIERVFSSEGKQ